MRCRINNRNLLARYGCASKASRETRGENAPDYEALHVMKQGTVGTDGHKLIVVSHPANVKQDYGTLHPSQFARLTVTIPDDARRLLTVPLEEPEEITRPIQLDKAFRQLQGCAQIDFTCDIRELQTLVNAAAKFTDHANGLARVRLYQGSNTPLRLDMMPTTDDQTFTAMLMPLRDYSPIPGDNGQPQAVPQDGEALRALMPLTVSTGRLFRTDDLETKR